MLKYINFSLGHYLKSHYSLCHSQGVLDLEGGLSGFTCLKCTLFWHLLVCKPNYSLKTLTLVEEGLYPILIFEHDFALLIDLAARVCLTLESLILLEVAVDKLEHVLDVIPKFHVPVVVPADLILEGGVFLKQNKFLHLVLVFLSFLVSFHALLYLCFHKTAPLILYGVYPSAARLDALSVLPLD